MLDSSTKKVMTAALCAFDVRVARAASKNHSESLTLFQEKQFSAGRCRLARLNGSEIVLYIPLLR